ncbi:unnamed protein product [Rhizoctonia solani]|uniref:WW domain-containing protein n=1 Tax=Rhizoctonia solani TaxID=456999 RepID=A0A8H2W7E4_9AGAM|nr:unnamed protein product [Rhizoctonia solani]
MSHPSPFVDNSRLWEVLPSQTNRYDDVFAGSRGARTVINGSQPASNTDSDPQTQRHAVPDGWVEYIHPVEGRPYYYNSELRVMTESHLHHLHRLSITEEWYTVFQELRNRTLPDAATFDVFLNCDDRNTCRYYMIDHANSTICWLRDLQTSDIGLPDIRSELGLRARLSEEYWIHVEYFPKNENYLDTTLSELRRILAPCMLDHMTSEGSTSPITKAEYESYLLSLNQAAESGHILLLNWSIARIMGLLAPRQNRNRYRQCEARTDRSIAVVGATYHLRSEGYRSGDVSSISTGTRLVNNISTPLVGSWSSNVWGSVGRQITNGLKTAINGIGVLPGVLYLEAFERRNALEDQRTRFQTHLGALSDILRSYTGGTSYGQPGLNLPFNRGTLELQSLSCSIVPDYERSMLICGASFIDSVRQTLDERSRTPTSIPYSRFLNAEERQRQLEEAIESASNRTSEFLVNLAMRHESVLERKLWELSKRIQALEDKLSGV